MGLLEAAPPPKPAAPRPKRASVPPNAGGRVPKEANPTPAAEGGRGSCACRPLERSNHVAALT
eukprot:3257213-Alexandrium_andersonii.AAC.1